MKVLKTTLLKFTVMEVVKPKNAVFDNGIM